MGLFPADEELKPFTSTSSSIPRSLATPSLLLSAAALLFNSDFRIIQSVLRSSKYSHASVTHMDILPSHLHHLRCLHLSDASKLHLSVAPPPTVPLLRHERKAIETEALTLNILRPTGLPVPGVVRHDTTDKLLGAPFLLTTSLPGTRLSTIASSLAAPLGVRRLSVDAQISRLVSIVSSHSAPAFGPIPLVAAGRGFRHWRDGYRSMLSDAIKDAEDASVHLPYAQIWEAIDRAQIVLDEVKDSKLVVPGLTDDENIFVEMMGGGHLRVCGLVGFQGAFWGDVEMGRRSKRNISNGYELEHSNGRRRVRQLLYSIYYAIVDIAVAGFRPLGSEQRDLDARRLLTSSLASLKIAQLYF